MTKTSGHTLRGNADSNPFVGPRPIQMGEPLYGRKTEVRELYENLKGHRIVVLHSPSGAGKSSLVHAGLIPRLREARFDVWRPIRVNLDPTSFEGVPEEVNRYLLSALVSLEDELPAKRRRSPAELARLDWLEYLDGRPRRKGRTDQSVVLLFDQFEEILSVDPRAVEAKRAFFSRVGAALDTGRYWALFIIREDYLAALAPYRDLIPTQMSNTYRLDLLGLGGAREAVLKLAQEGGRSFPAVDKLIRDLSTVQVQQADGSFVAEQGLHVEPVYMQVVCRRLWAAMPADATTIDEASVEAYAQVSKSLAGYYGDALAEIARDDVALERAIRDWVGTRLIVGGIRSQVRQQAGSDAGIEAVHIEQLLDSYLVRSEQRAGANWYELSHDRLVEPVLQDNEAWEQAHLHPLQVQAKLWEDGGRARARLLDPDALPDANAWASANAQLLTAGEREFLGLSQERRDQQVRQRRGRRLFTAALSVVAVVAVGFGVLARQAGQESERQRQEADKARETAETALVQAEQARAQAEEAKTQAEQAKTQAEQAKTQAEKTQKENERSVRQMFEVALRPVVEHLIDKRQEVGVVELDARWTPLLERDEQALVAASLGSDFRIVVVGHESVLSEADADGRSLFLEITAQWLLADQARRKVAIVPSRSGRSARLEALQRNLLRLEYEFELSPALTEPDALADFGMVILDDCQALDAEQRAAIERFVDRGGGVLAAGAGPRWLTGKGPGKGAKPTLDDYPMNLALASRGARWVDATIDSKQLEQREVPAVVRFENTLAVEVNLYTINADQEEYYTTLDSREVRELLTVIGRTWVIRATADGRRIDTVEIEDQEQSVTIGATVAKTKLKTKPKPKTEPEKPDSKPAPKATAQLPKSLSGEDIQAGLVIAKKAAKRCGKELRTLMSEVSLRMKVGGDGKVANVSILPPAKGSSEGACIKTAVSKLSFPKSKQGGEAKWTLKLY
ncbi:MAG: hypothetical protein AAGF11_44505 [Myxococcota bacterium]